MSDQLTRKLAAVINDPPGPRRGPSWGRQHDSYAPVQETQGEWAARAVLATLEDQGRLLPAPDRVATLLPASETRNSTTAIVRLEGPREILRFMANMLNWQCDIGSAAKAVLVDLRETMGYAEFDDLARTLLGGDLYAKHHHRFERDWECCSCYTTVRVGGRYAPTSDAGAVCASCCKGYPEEMARLVKRPAPVAVPA